MFNVVNYYRLSSYFGATKFSFLSKIIDYIIRLVFSCWIPHTVKSGRNLVLGYGGLSIVIHSDVVIGDNVHIDQCVTIGGNGTVYGVPKIGNNVYIGAGAKILGPITIGDECVIAANAVVLSSIPSGSVAAGVPSKIVKEGIVLNEYLYHLKNVVD